MQGVGTQNTRPRVASVQRSATVAWSPTSQHAALMAAGTVAGAISDSFDASAQLELFSLDLGSRSGRMPLLGSVQTNERFHRLAWGSHGHDSGVFSHGIIAGGMVDGSIKIFNPAVMLTGTGADPLVASIDRHSGAVRGLEFNPGVSNLLASGAGESEILITDLSNPSSPSVYSPGVRSNAPPADISCVAWNRKVMHILASTSHNGQSVVWDLKLKKPVISFTDPNNKTQRNSVIEWSPDVATKVLIASEDDRSPALQIWDLRNAFAPVMELVGHEKGILSAAWCPNDSNLLLSSGKDNRILCWDPNAGVILSELPAGQNWTFDVNWSPKIPAILSCSSFDGEVSVFSLQDSGGSTHSGTASGALRAPRWLKRPCGATFGFGGKLAVFSETKGVSVDIVPVVTDKEIVARAEKLQEALESQDLYKFCVHKAMSARLERDKTEWELMQVLCSGQDQRRQLLSFLGVEPPQEPTNIRQAKVAAIAPPPTDEDPAELFSQLAVATEAAEEAAASAAAVAAAAAEEQKASAAWDDAPEFQLQQPPQPPMSNKDASLLSRAMLTGDIEAAVAVCMRNGRVADALVLAASGGPELWTATRDQFLQSATTPLMRKMSAIVHQDFVKYVQESDLAAWKETLTLVNTYSGAEELSDLCDQLGARLEAELGDSASASLCYMCAANISKVTALWSTYHCPENGGSPHSTSSLLDFMEKLVIFQEAAQIKEGYMYAADKVTEFADKLAAQGYLAHAMQFLLKLSDSSPTGLAAVLMDRIHGQNGTLLTGPPPIPFPLVHVGVAPEAVHSDVQHDNAQYAGYDATQYAGYDGSQYAGYDASQYSGYEASQHVDYSAYAQQPPAPAPAPYSYTAPAKPPAPMPVPVHAPAPAPVQTAAPAPPAFAYTSQAAPYTYAPYPPSQQVPAVPPPAPAPAPPPPPPKPSYNPQPVLDVLHSLTTKCGQFNLASLDRRKLDDVEKRIASLQEKLATGVVSITVFEKLQQICSCLAAYDIQTALAIHVDITTTDWTENQSWLIGLKRLIELVAKLGVTP